MALVSRHIEGSIIMLNLLRFRKVADYSATPELTPSTSISGEKAYKLYIAHAQPFLQQAGGELLFLGEGGGYLIGPSAARWDLAMLVRHRNVDAFMSFATNEEYLAGMGHRTAALEDSRLLPLINTNPSKA